MFSGLFTQRANAQKTSSFSLRPALVGAVVCAILGVASAAQAADCAIICGVNQYPGLRPGANLSGCVNDARSFAEKLKLYGFKAENITILNDAAASHDGILNAIRGLSTKVTNADRVVFYFAGHGTVGSDGKSVILPGNAKDDVETNDIQTDELYEAVKGLPSGRKTIILDSCHSGGMVRDIKGLKSFHNNVPRYYVRTKKLTRSGKRDGTKEWQEVDTNGADNLKTENLEPDGTICYFTAALKSQVAAETELGGERHGVFTYSLTKNMTGQKSLWQDLSATVSADVASATDNEQKPLLFPTSFLQKVAFDQPGVKPAPKPVSLEELYALSAPDPAKVSIKLFASTPNSAGDLKPAISPVIVNKDKIRMDVTVGAPGYLIVIGKDPKGKLVLLYPRGGANAEVSAAKVTAGSTIGLPSDPTKSFYADTAGTDGVKALLFTEEGAARAMVRSFKRGPLTKPTGVKTREWIEWEETKVDPGPGFFTSEILTQIVDDTKTGSAAPGTAAP